MFPGQLSISYMMYICIYAYIHIQLYIYTYHIHIHISIYSIISCSTPNLLLVHQLRSPSLPHSMSGGSFLPFTSKNCSPDATPRVSCCRSSCKRWKARTMAAKLGRNLQRNWVRKRIPLSTSTVLLVFRCVPLFSHGIFPSICSCTNLHLNLRWFAHSMLQLHWSCTHPHKSSYIYRLSGICLRGNGVARAKVAGVNKSTHRESRLLDLEIEGGTFR